MTLAVRIRTIASNPAVTKPDGPGGRSRRENCPTFFLTYFYEITAGRGTVVATPWQQSPSAKGARP
jgi:hypothetical protein